MHHAITVNYAVPNVIGFLLYAAHLELRRRAPSGRRAGPGTRVVVACGRPGPLISNAPTGSNRIRVS